MPSGMKLLSILILAAAFVGCGTTNRNLGRPCERCTHGYAPASDRHAEQRTVCVIDGKIMNCDKVPAECSECARIQRHDMDRNPPPAH